MMPPKSIAQNELTVKPPALPPVPVDSEDEGEEKQQTSKIPPKPPTPPKTSTGERTTTSPEKKQSSPEKKSKPIVLTKPTLPIPPKELSPTDVDSDHTPIPAPSKKKTKKKKNVIASSEADNLSVGMGSLVLEEAEEEEEEDKEVEARGQKKDKGKKKATVREAPGDLAEEVLEMVKHPKGRILVAQFCHLADNMIIIFDNLPKDTEDRSMDLLHERKSKIDEAYQRMIERWGV